MFRFDKGLRGSALKPYSLGYSAPSTDDINTEDPNLQFGGIKDEGVWLDDRTLPAVIELSVRLNSVWVDSTLPTLAQLGDHAPCVLYAPRGVVASIQVVYAGTGRYQRNSGDEGITLPEGFSSSDAGAANSLGAPKGKPGEYHALVGLWGAQG